MLLHSLMFLLMSFFITVSGELPLWKKHLIDYHEWHGDYSYNRTSFPCTITALSVNLTESTPCLVLFFIKENVHLEMSVSSDDNVIVLFQEDYVWTKNAHYVNNTGFVIRGQFVEDDLYYKLIGNVSAYGNKDFGTINLRPTGLQTQVYPPRNTGLSYGLAVGLPISLAILLMISGVLILWWGVRKGYLRYVPRAYKFFTNPRRSRSDPDHEMNDHERQSEEPEIHI